MKFLFFFLLFLTACSNTPNTATKVDSNVVNVTDSAKNAALTVPKTDTVKMITMLDSLQGKWKQTEGTEHYLTIKGRTWTQVFGKETMPNDVFILANESFYDGNGTLPNVAHVDRKSMNTNGHYLYLYPEVLDKSGKLSDEVGEEYEISISKDRLELKYETKYLTYNRVK